MMAPDDVYPTPFWLVWSPQGATPPRYLHSTSASADAEAERLAAQYPGKEFFVLEPTYRVVRKDIDRTRYHRDGVPF